MLHKRSSNTKVQIWNSNVLCTRGLGNVGHRKLIIFKTPSMKVGLMSFWSWNKKEKTTVKNLAVKFVNLIYLNQK